MRFLPLVVLLAACEEAPPPIPGQLERTGAVIKTVNGQNVTEGMVDALLSQAPPGTKDQLIAKGQLDRVKEKLVMDELLYQEAVKAKVHEKAEVKSAIALAERDVIARALLNQIVTERTGDEAVKAWYNDHLVQFARKQVKARHILVKDKAEAEAILAQVKADPASFSKVATEKSVDARSGKAGGDLGWFDEKQMVPEFATAAFAGAKGEIIGPVQSKFGFHVIAIDDKRESIPVEEVTDKIKSQLQAEVAEKYIEELKKAATITDAAGAGGATVSPASTDADKGEGGIQVQKLDGPPPGAAPATPGK